jgi:hypothetical protein
MTGVASFHLVRHRHASAAFGHLGLDRRLLRHTPGLVFWRLLGTGSGRDTGPGADLRRTALFAVWHDEAALDEFLGASPVAGRWQRAHERYTVRLRGLGGHGTWRGVDVLGAIERAVEGTGPVAAVTRADVRLRHWRTFARAGEPVNAELQGAGGLLAVVGVGEAPVGRQGTFSLWRSAKDLAAFAYRMPEHAAVVRRTRIERWYGEELFARFHPYASDGTWDGHDPLVSG